MEWRFPCSVFRAMSSVEISTNADFTGAHRFEVSNVREWLHGDSLLNVITGAKRIR